MHWAMILRFYGDQLATANPRLATSLLTRLLVRLLDIADDEGLPDLTDYGYPEPHQPHPAGTTAQRRKIEEAQSAAGDTPVVPMVHGYGPAADFRQRLTVAWQASPQGVWINRYGYLSDEKLAIVAEVCRA